MARTNLNTQPIPFRYPERTFEGGRLEYHDGIPVLQVAGAPDAIGRQVAELALRHVGRLLDYPLDYLRFKVRIPLLPNLLMRLLRRKCRQLFDNVPPQYRAEVDAMSVSGLDRPLLVAANTLFDLSGMGLLPMLGCSSLVVPPERSATSGLLFGRNLDYFSLGYLHNYSLVTVYRPLADRLGFVSVGFPAVVGCFSGMNQAGLCLARHEVLSPKVKRTFNPRGVPFAICFRQVLETCRSVSEAVGLIERTPHVTVNNLVLCDASGGTICEITPDGIRCRPLEDGLGACTNHFLHSEFVNPKQPDDYETLGRLNRLETLSRNAPPRMGLEQVRQALHGVHQGDLTLQSMIFEPESQTIHVAFGEGPVTANRLVPLVMSRFWKE